MTGSSESAPGCRRGMEHRIRTTEALDTVIRIAEVASGAAAAWLAQLTGRTVALKQLLSELTRRADA